MIIGPLDLGSPSHPWLNPITGQVLGSVILEGSDTITWGRAGIERVQHVAFSLKAWQSLGGQAAMTSGAARYLLKQLEELSLNPAYAPVYIQWSSTADPAAFFNAVDLHDGWYVITNFEPNYRRSVLTAIVECRMSVSEASPGGPRRVVVGYSGAARSPSNYSGAAVNLLSLPVGSQAYESAFTRTGAEGVIPCILSPFASPEPIALSTTLANISKGGVHVYDTLNTGTNPVPIAGGLFVHASWVEVFHSAHTFIGDCVITNGLELLLFVVGGPQICTAYLWNTALAVANWQQYALVQYFDSAVNLGALRGYTLGKVGPEECALSTVSSTSPGNLGRITMRLIRGRVEVWTDFVPLTQAATAGDSIALAAPSTPKVFYNSLKAADNVLGETATPSTDYGFGAAFITSTTYPFIFGFLYQNQPGSQQPFNNGAGSTTTGLGDTASLAINARRTYGFFAVPYGTSGSFSTANLQAEAESSGSLGTGLTSQANAAASGGNEVKVATGTTNASTGESFGSATFTPAVGTYDLWFRLKVASIVSAVPQLQCFLGLTSGGGASAICATAFAPSQLGTGYVWVRSNFRSLIDGVLNSTTTVTSATGAFSNQDQGKAISGIGIPAGTTISSVTNGTTIVLSAAATATASGVTLNIGAAFTPIAASNVQFRVLIFATLTTDFFIDEAVLAPHTLAAALTGPREVWQQFMFDRTAQLLRI